MYMNCHSLEKRETALPCLAGMQTPRHMPVWVGLAFGSNSNAPSSFQDAVGTFLEQRKRVPLSRVASLLPWIGDISSQQWCWACLLPLESQAAKAPSLLRAELCSLASASQTLLPGRVGEELPPSPLQLVSNGANSASGCRPPPIRPPPSLLGLRLLHPT